MKGQKNFFTRPSFSPAFIFLLARKQGIILLAYCLFMYCLLKAFFEFPVLKLMFQCSYAADLIWREQCYSTFCLHETILLDIVKNLERNGRKMIMKRMLLNKRYFIGLLML